MTNSDHPTATATRSTEMATCQLHLHLAVGILRLQTAAASEQLFVGQPEQWPISDWSGWARDRVRRLRRGLGLPRDICTSCLAQFLGMGACQFHYLRQGFPAALQLNGTSTARVFTGERFWPFIQPTKQAHRLQSLAFQLEGPGFVCIQWADQVAFVGELVGKILVFEIAVKDLCAPSLWSATFARHSFE